MDPFKMNPEVKWRTAVSLLLNFIHAFHVALKNHTDEQTARAIHNYLVQEFWTEQAEAFTDLFALQPNQAYVLKRIFAAIFDIEYKTKLETSDEVIDTMNYESCPFRKSLSPVFEEVCKACERIGQIFVQKVNPHLTHEVQIYQNTCHHITKKRP
ncbi:MAG: hypothetical protein ACTSRS_12835 [Candidatus Helarchaeota archaeon]